MQRARPRGGVAVRRDRKVRSQRPTAATRIQAQRVERTARMERKDDQGRHGGNHSPAEKRDKQNPPAQANRNTDVQSLPTDRNDNRDGGRKAGRRERVESGKRVADRVESGGRRTL